LLAGTRAAFDARSARATHRLERLARDGNAIDVVVDGRQRRIDFAIDDAGHGHWQCEGAELAASDVRLRGAERERGEASGVLVAPMHGRVTQACVAEGSEVAAGALLIVIEAMKMEHQIRAPHAGRIASLHVRAGDQVAARQPLVEVAA
jgi:geranyl-CoA carboxylase alpha subunit